jgi:hypothetical protein
MPIVPSPRPIPLPADWEEMPGSPRERGDFTTQSAVMTIKVRWADRYKIYDRFVTQFEPYPHQVYGTGGDSVVNALRATSGTIKPFTPTGVDKVEVPGGSIYVHEFAILEITFGVPKIGIPVLTNISHPRGRGDIISEHMETTSEFLTLPFEDFEWWSDSKAITRESAPGHIRTGLIYTFTRHNVAEVPVQAFDYVDTVNSDWLTPLSPPLQHLRFAPGDMLYKGMSLQRSADRNLATVKMSISYRFHWRIGGWNKFYRGDTAVSDYLHKKGSPAGAKHFPFAEKEFGSVF